MRYHLGPGNDSFLVLDVSKISVSRANLLLRTSPALWIVLQLTDRYFVLSPSELQTLLERKKPSSLLQEAIKLDRLTPSYILSSPSETIELPERPAGSTPVGRAVYIRKSKNAALAVFRAGPLTEFIAGEPHAKKVVTKKVVAKKAPAKKAVAKKAVYIGTGRTRSADSGSFSLGFAPGPSGKGPPPKTEGPAKTTEVIDVFFATDRAPSLRREAQHSRASSTTCPTDRS
jgi:hypothetical protein